MPKTETREFDQKIGRTSNIALMILGGLAWISTYGANFMAISVVSSIIVIAITARRLYWTIPNSILNQDIEDKLKFPGDVQSKKTESFYSEKLEVWSEQISLQKPFSASLIKPAYDISDEVFVPTWIIVEDDEEIIYPFGRSLKTDREMGNQIADGEDLPRNRMQFEY